MELSAFGKRFSGQTGIGELMDDLGRALGGQDDMLMMGGGNPGHIPEMQAIWRRRMEEILGEGQRFEQMLGNYDPPQGNARFISSLVRCLNDACGWDLTEENVCVTNGGQTAFFCLLNMLAGKQTNGRRKRILFPLTPEYIGYADQGVDSELFVANKPQFEFIDDHTFKYHVDFESLDVGDDVAAICVSRPTNPTGNVLTDDEIGQLAKLADARGIPLIIDNAYGSPFPNAMFTEVQPVWNENIVLTLSLSKLGLPGTRTGIVIARKEITSALSSMNAVVGLANGNIGQVLVEPLLASGELIRISREIIQPYYYRKSLRAVERVHECFDAKLPYRVHKSEGAFFLWLWFERLPITTQELYRRLKERRTLVVPGRYFFYGLDGDWQHSHECIRMTFSQSDETVQKGVAIIAEEMARAYAV
ncbi:MAG: valine--pyruvate transaminase [Verrucomicrobia bacterium]|nr:valine--pyruvate transaminase [Verrucomicrobiota bacterium]